MNVVEVSDDRRTPKRDEFDIIAAKIIEGKTLLIQDATQTQITGQITRTVRKVGLYVRTRSDKDGIIVWASTEPFHRKKKG